MPQIAIVIAIIPITPATGTGLVAGISLVSEISLQFLHTYCFSPGVNSEASLVVTHSYSCSIAGISSVYVSPHTSQVYVIEPASVQVAPFRSVSAYL